ncbi:gliding motility-associated-like protein [Larkinella arboricola]|uniref:Gliding motility-associated-like protein n=1 Tax=Larkinella arboricola TaxID=643671 RepID=A0A327X6Y1_LARAB|nr:gliding motility-associated C-terminal domain-containing protein [Larkinella arboricola]RAK02419.1 gliding motility-associated-like protein [Larkinella arboricola]
MTQRNTFFLLLLLLGLTNWLSASHIVGGNVRLTRPGTADQFTLSLNLFIDDLNSRAGDIKPTVKLAIYRRRDNLKMGEFELPLLNQQPLAASNQACAQLRPLKLREVVYSKDIELSADRFDDPGGYYVVHGVCCRSGAIDNITQADESGMVFYLDFPSPKTTPNSSPTFSIPTGEYACKGQPFSFSFKATDADGDQLKYSLVTPYKGFTDQGTAYDNQPSSAYPTVGWRPGFSAENAVPGAPALSINSETGQLNVTASQVGLFAFAVLCEEFRNGQRIGAVRRDFQLAVVDCPTNTPPAPVIQLAHAPVNAHIEEDAGGIVTSVSVCQGQEITLRTESSAEWSFQWQRDGQNLEGDTTATLVVKASGDYTVIKKYRNTCGKPSPAQTSVRVDMTEAEKLKLTASGPTAFCDGRSVILKAPEGSYTYAWFKNDQPIPDARESDYQPHETGEFKIQIFSAITGCTVTDSVQVQVYPKPVAVITPPPTTTACSGDTIRLNAVANPLYRYQWENTGTILNQEVTSSLAATQPGYYVLTVTDTNQCQAVSDGIRLTFNTAPTVSMTRLPAICENATERLSLQAEPGGGTFTGIGRAAGAVSASEFDPSKTGPGQFVITYTLSQAGNACPGRAQQTVQVLPAPFITVSDVTVRRGSEVQLNPTSIDTLTYVWTPSMGLSSPVTARPYASPDTTTTYRVKVTTPQGCEFTAQLTVTVITALYIPDAFTPNNDGLNDNWVIRGIADYPNCTVEVYNRWGNPVFVSKGYLQPWDGRSNGQDLPPAVYHYVIKPGDSQPHRSGSVLITR